MVEVKGVGRKDYMGFQWFKIVVDGDVVCEFHALNIQHAMAMYKQYRSISSKLMSDSLLTKK